MKEPDSLKEIKSDRPVKTGLELLIIIIMEFIKFRRHWRVNASANLVKEHEYKFYLFILNRKLIRTVLLNTNGVWN